MNPDPLASEDDPDAGALPPDVLALALLQLRASGDHDAADALVKAHGGGGGGEDDPGDDTTAKAMSSLAGSAGGFLVPPAAARKSRSRRKRRARRVVKAILRDVEGE